VDRTLEEIRHAIITEILVTAAVITGGYTAGALAPEAAVASRGLASGLGEASEAGQVVRTIEHGEKVADLVEEVAVLARTSGSAHAVVSLANGERVIVAGGEHGIDLAGMSVRRVIGHTHPVGAPPGLSAQDIGYMSQAGQSGSYLLELREGGAWLLSKFNF
jgi:hypothetical protein